MDENEERMIFKILPKPNEYVEISYYFQKDENEILKELRRLYREDYLIYIPTIPNTKGHSGYILSKKGEELYRYLGSKFG